MERAVLASTPLCIPMATFKVEKPPAASVKHQPPPAQLSFHFHGFNLSIQPGTGACFSGTPQEAVPVFLWAAPCRTETTAGA